MVDIPRLIIAGTHTGVGKTTVALGLMRALQGRGLRVQGFKAGPDFIDPSHHARATRRPGRNLDSWMCSDEVVRELFVYGCADADLAIVEGMMGLFDGAGGLDERGSTAHLAKLLKAPVVLVIDAWALARSAGAMALGYQVFDAQVRLAGVLLNRLAGPGHLDHVAPAIEARTGLKVLGWLPKDAGIFIEEQHLGLVTAEAWNETDAWYDRLGERVAATVDLDRLLAVARAAEPLPVPPPTGSLAPGSGAASVRIGLARDEAFSFYYQDNLDFLRAAGATLVPFSPLRDARLPDAHLLYFGGGFPELFAAQLGRNRTMLEDVRAFIARGLPVYAECGGLMYLGQSIETFDGSVVGLVGVLPLTTSMAPRKLTLGYVQVTTQRDTILAPSGTTFRGHEFHYSVLKPRGPVTYAYGRSRGSPGSPLPPDGFVQGNLLAGYTHAHFGSHPRLAQNLVATARKAAD